jgi:hypothetical protein
MDPLSIIAAGITVAGAVQVSLKHVHDTYGARADLFALSNEVSDLNVIFQEIRDIVQKQKDVGPSAPLVQLAERINAKLEQLRLQIAEWKTSPKEIKARARQLRWLRISSKANAFREEFRNLRSQLTAILSASSVLVKIFLTRDCRSSKS